MKEKLTRWHPVDHLRSEEDQVAYFNACIDDDPGDGCLIRAALGDIARARGMTSVAKATGMSREGLYRALATGGNPEFATIMRVVNALGFHLHAV
ncbi:addiction module antidote protein [Luteibacter yeojuensis]|uniref:Putative addiction module antidote protein n=1 Tax=Luteibacter yeojuensis TaxID=345309 RepID=A0A7X5QVK1_9GAMM|nr:addiction module antidote protein [Luteibacter yeojuensis]NID16208.1 putative addiction module antidote protein [Luteibacter yeojuensis]